MKHQNENKEWNALWLKQIALWQAEVDDLLDRAKALVALIKLAKSQIKRDPSRVIGFGACFKSVMALKAPRVVATFISGPHDATFEVSKCPSHCPYK